MFVVSPERALRSWLVAPGPKGARLASARARTFWAPWNSLPVLIQALQDLTQFRGACKTELFSTKNNEFLGAETLWGEGNAAARVLAPGLRAGNWTGERRSSLSGAFSGQGSPAPLFSPGVRRSYKRFHPAAGSLLRRRTDLPLRCDPSAGAEPGRGTPLCAGALPLSPCGPPPPPPARQAPALTEGRCIHRGGKGAAAASSLCVLGQSIWAYPSVGRCSLGLVANGTAGNEDVA